jgi:hypothetical protein
VKVDGFEIGGVNNADIGAICSFERNLGDDFS